MKMIKDNKVTITINGKEVEIELTKEQVEKLTKKESRVWKPEIGDYYYYITMDGKTGKTDNMTDFDKRTIDFGNVFKTKEEAEFVVEKLKVEKQLRDYIAENSEPVDWSDNNYKYYITYRHNGIWPSERLQIEKRTYMQSQGTIYASNEEVLEETIKHIGEDRIKKYLFGIK